MTQLNETQNLKVFAIDDGGEMWWYVAASAKDARDQHIDLNYLKTREMWDDNNVVDCGALPDEKELSVLDKVPEKRTAREWCKEGAGFLATTCY